MKSVNKLIKKQKHQNKVNPGHKTKYVPLPRGRACTYKMKTKYNRRNRKNDINKAIFYWESYKED